jgi:hypothetical protein
LPPELASLPLTALADRLRVNFSPAEASALAEQVTLRCRASDKLGAADGWLLTADGLEMMTAPAVAARRAHRLAGLGLPVLDLTCGLGTDLRACTDAGLAVTGLERDAATAILAAANVPAAGIVRGDATNPPFLLSTSAMILDPSRRGAKGRRFDPAAFSPSWDVCLGLLAEAPAGVLKAPPGIDHTYFPAGCEAEFIQLGRSLRECALWTGAGARPGLRRAVLLPAGAELDSEAPEAPATTAPPGPVLYDPESCVTRAGLVRHLAARLEAWMLDPQVAYLSGSAARFDALCATFAVLEALPFGLERLRKRLRDLGANPVEIRRRAFPIEPDDLRRQLGPIEGEPVTLLCTTLSGRRTIFITRRIAAHADARLDGGSR